MSMAVVSRLGNDNDDEVDNDEDDEYNKQVDDDDYEDEDEDDEDDVEVGHVTNGECNSALMGGPSFTPGGTLGKEGWR